MFTGATTVEGIPAVHPVEIYVDLKGHPERASEAAEHLRENKVILGLLNAAS